MTLSATVTGKTSDISNNTAKTPVVGPANGLHFRHLQFVDLNGWTDTDHQKTFQTFLASCRRLIDNPPHERQLGLPVNELLGVCHEALAFTGDDSQGRPKDLDERKLGFRNFFERHFDPVALITNGAETPGYFTGYFEPVVDAARVKSAKFPVPLYRTPDDLVRTKGRDLPMSWDPDMAFALDGPDGLQSYPKRSAIETGYLKGRGLELAYVQSWVDAFFIHIQGSVRLRFDDGSLQRLSYAAKNGHPYTSIGRLLIDADKIAKADMTMSSLRQWLTDNPQDGLDLMRRNASFIFFEESEGLGEDDGPSGAAGLPLRDGISLAVDRTWHLFGTPIWIDVPGHEAKDGFPAQSGYQSLMIAQDTGSAITGPTRADIFVGTGEDAGTTAGRIRNAGRFVVLWPKPSSGRVERP